MKTILKKGMAVASSAAIVALMSGAMAQAAITGVSGGSLSIGGAASSSTTGAIISNPPFVVDDNVENSLQQGFNEAQGVVLGADLDVDAATDIAAGTRVDSHMIFLNSDRNLDIKHYNVMWTFSGTILGVMSDINGNLEAASSGFLGAAGTTYDNGNASQSAPFNNRGLEGGGDGYSIAGNILTLSMHVTEPGDWIRVVTVSAVPLPAALPLYGAGVAVLGFFGWRRKKKAASI